LSSSLKQFNSISAADTSVCGDSGLLLGKSKKVFTVWSKRKRQPQMKLAVVAKKLARLIRLIELCPPALGNEEQLQRVATFTKDWLEDVKLAVNTYLLIQKSRNQAAASCPQNVPEGELRQTETRSDPSRSLALSQSNVFVGNLPPALSSKVEPFKAGSNTGMEPLETAFPDGVKHSAPFHAPAPAAVNSVALQTPPGVGKEGMNGANRNATITQLVERERVMCHIKS
jgi:hypothetical protein